MRRLFSPFILLCGTGMFAIFSSTISKNPVLPLFSESLGASVFIIGVIAACSTVTGIIVSLPAGVLSDFYGRRKVILSGAFVFVSAPFLYFLVNAPWQLAIVRAYHGLATAIFGPVAIALVADLFIERRGESMGWYSSSRLMGRALAPTVGGRIIDLSVGQRGGSVGWASTVNRFLRRYGYKSVYFVCGGAGLLMFILSSIIPMKRKARTSESASLSVKLKEMGEGLKEIGKTRGIMVTSCVEAIQWLAFGALEPFLPLYCVALGIKFTAIGILATIQIIATALSSPVMGRLSDKYGRRRVISLGLLLGAVGLGMIPFLKTFWTLIFAVVLFGISFAAVTTSTSAFVSDLAKAESRGSALGVMSTIMDIGQASGPIIGGTLLRVSEAKVRSPGSSYMVMFLTVSALLLLMGGSFPLLVGKPRSVGSHFANINRKT
jgi:DHA1 family multidrug resistance protein-like MFS transporter